VRPDVVGLMRVLCSFPGRAGDIIWALPAIRAVSEHFGVPVDLVVAGEFESLVPLLTQQPYLGTVTADPRWGLASWIDAGGSLQEAWQPPYLPEGADHMHVFHLGYRRWPELPLPFEVADTLRRVYFLDLPPLDLARPWITSPPWHCRVAHGWSDCWFELKYGLVNLLYLGNSVDRAGSCAPPHSRWTSEGNYLGTSWEDAAHLIAGAKGFLGDCSALHVLAVALGTPVVIMEPMEARWNPIFYPLGTHGPQVTVVRGHDGRPTFDAHHVAEALEARRCA